jgi:hypothetical protein
MISVSPRGITCSRVRVNADTSRLNPVMLKTAAVRASPNAKGA